jgi:putative Holliday junction resolvase
MKYMGIDFGTKRIGVALSDDSGTIAFPYEIIGQSPRAQIEIASIAAEKGVNEIVIGESLDMFGKPNKVMDDIARFAMELGEETDLPVHFEKEFLTSHHATAQRGKSSLHAKQTKIRETDPVDASAAALILQRFLDRKNSN